MQKHNYFKLFRADYICLAATWQALKPLSAQNNSAALKRTVAALKSVRSPCVFEMKFLLTNVHTLSHGLCCFPVSFVLLVQRNLLRGNVKIGQLLCSRVFSH